MEKNNRIILAEYRCDLSLIAGEAEIILLFSTGNPIQLLDKMYAELQIPPPEIQKNKA